jgi:hypothetical protein
MSQGSAKSNIGPQGVTGAIGPQGVTGSIGPTGATGAGIGNKGTAIISFGSAPGTNVVTTIVTGQTGILSTSLVQAFMMDGHTADHNITEHILVSTGVIFNCNTIVPGVGFTITAVTQLRLTGQFLVNWIWN